ncbi:MAG: hypothetical protein GY869_07450, partial [Planctomycetes bacterium]|nr:hypothetical protein [Planctomycetota bacterium]
LGMVCEVWGQVDPNLVGWWKLDEGVGTLAADAAGGHDGWLVGNPVWVAGIDNNGLEFDGVEDGVDVGHHADLNLGTGAFTLAVWIRNENTIGSVYKRIITKRGDNITPSFYSMFLYDNKLRVELMENFPSEIVTFSAGPAIQGDGLWHHVGCVRDEAGDVYLYVDGVEYYVGVSTEDLSNADNVEFGTFWSEAFDGETYKGRMDDVRIYKSALSLERIKHLAGWAIEPMPSNGDTGLSVGTQLSFMPSPVAASHDVYLDTVNPPVAQLANDSTETSFDPGPLEYGRKYYWRVNENTVPGKSVIGEVWNFTAFVEPAVTTQPATNITKTTATLNGILDNLGESASVDVRFEYGKTPGEPYSYQTDLEMMAATGDFDFDITNLDSGSTYYYRAAVYGEDNSQAYGDEQSFMTVPWQGSGVEGDAYQISTSEHLHYLSENSDYWDPNIYFELVDDIVISPGTIINPIGVDDMTPYHGVFDGGDYTITGLNQSGTGNLGLFGYTTTNARISHLSLADVTINGVSGLGMLVGYNQGRISDCSATGVVSGGDYSSGLGGLVGRNISGTISGCSVTGTVTGISRIGGLVGENTNGNIIDCSAAGSIIGGIQSSNLGGLVGDNFSGTISDCYAAGTVEGGYQAESIGGLLGVNNRGMISYCYATGTVTGGDYSHTIGGLVGYNANYSSIKNCYATGAVSGGVQTWQLGG